MGRNCRLVLVLLVLAVPAAVVWVRSPPPLAEDAAPEVFSATRAVGELEWIAAAPRPAGSEANARVRARLFDELSSLGLEVRLQSGNVTIGSAEEEEPEPVPIVNVLARRRGTGAGRALLLVAHHDSVPEGPGAADDGAAVAALLETVRALGHAAPPSNDLVVLITDGEELGLFGAQLFVEDPWFADVGAVLNFEARGAGGPSILFQVGPASGALVEAYARHAPHPFGTSLAPAVYERMPNDTDFTIFLRAGVPGLNFAFLGGGAAYHTAADDLAELHPGSLQHHGEAMTSLARAVGELDLDALDAVPELEFFPVPGGLARYPRAWTPVLGLLLAVLAAALCGRGGRALVRGVAGAALVRVPLAAGAAALVAWALGALLRPLGGVLEPFAAGAPGANLLSGELLAAGLWAGALGALLFVLAPASGAALRRPGSLADGAVLAWALAAAWLPFAVPGAGHVAVLALAGTLASRLVLRAREDALLRAFAAWLPAGLVLLPLVPLFVQVGSVRPLNEALLGAFAVGLLALACLPLACALAPRLGRRGGGVVALAGVALLVVRALVAGAGA